MKLTQEQAEMIDEKLENIRDSIGDFDALVKDMGFTTEFLASFFVFDEDFNISADRIFAFGHKGCLVTHAECLINELEDENEDDFINW